MLTREKIAGEEAKLDRGESVKAALEGVKGEAKALEEALTRKEEELAQSLKLSREQQEHTESLVRDKKQLIDTATSLQKEIAVLKSGESEKASKTDELVTDLREQLKARVADKETLLEKVKLLDGKFSAAEKDL